MLLMCVVYRLICCLLCLFFFKQKTAYEMRISDWSSDVCTTSLVNDVIMPPLGLLLGDLDFSDFFINLSGGADYPSLQAAKAAGAVTLNYGAFITTVINFLIIAFVIFMVIRQINRLKRSEEHTYELQSLMRNSYAVF